MAFKKGQSGNPKGRAKGSRHKVTIVAQELLDGEAQAITRKCVELALGGDVVALRLCLERLVPPRKDWPVAVKLPAMRTPGVAVKVSSAILQAVARGDLTPREGSALAGLVEVHRRRLELEELEARLTALEERTSHEKH